MIDEDMQSAMVDENPTGNAGATSGNMEAQLRAFIRASSDVVYRMSPDWLEMRQLDGRGFLADTTVPSIAWWDEYIFPDDRATISAVIDKAIRNKDTFELEHRVRRADGTVGWTFSRAIPVMNAAGEIVEWFGAAKDVTATRETEAKYRSLFEAVGQGYFLNEIVRDERGEAVDLRYLELNPAFERLTGIKAADALGRTMSELFGAADPDWLAAADRVVKSGRPERMERHVATLDRWYEAHYYRAGTDRVSGTYEDVTVRRKAEETLRESEARQAFLLSLGDRMRASADAATVIRIATHMLGQYLGASRIVFAEIDEPAGVALIREGWTATGAERHPPVLCLDDFGGRLLDDLRAGRTVRYEDVGSPPHNRPDLAALAAIGVRASLSVPLIAGGRFVVNINIHQDRPRHWTDAEVRLVEDVAERIWAAVERARAETARQRSEERLRQFGEASQDILWIRDAETFQWQYLTPAFEAIYGIDRAEALTGNNYHNWLDLIVPEDRRLAREMLERVNAGERVTFEYRIKRPSDGQLRRLCNTDFPIVDDAGNVVLIGGIGHDVTELGETEKRLRVLVEGIQQLVWRAVDDGGWTWASPQWMAFTGQPEPDSHGWGWLACLHADDREAVLAAWSHAMATGGFDVEYRLRRADGHYRWFGTRATPVRDDAGAIIEWLGSSTDIDDLRQLQQRQHVLLAELQHRVRNILAMIRSVARRTAEGPMSVSDYIQHFEGRINAMARTQALLTRAPGAGVDLQNLVRDELEAQSAQPLHYSCRGPDIALSPKAAEVLTLAVHELATNAVKYGALGTSEGLLSVVWSKESRAGADWLRLDWTESRIELPPLHDQRRGFGTELVTRRVPYELRGRGMMEFLPTGVHVRIEFPLVPGQSILQTDAGTADRTTGGQRA